MFKVGKLALGDGVWWAKDPLNHERSRLGETWPDGGWGPPF